MSRILQAGVLAATAALMLPTAAAAAVVATDTDNHVTYRLTGRSLTVALSSSTPTKVQRALSGHQIRFICGRDSKLVMTTKRWTRGAQRARVTLPRAPRNPQFCGMERVGSTDDLSYAFVR